MSLTGHFLKPTRRSLRQKIVISVGMLVLLSLLSSSLSLYRITEMNRLLAAINQFSVPLGRLIAQMQSDAEVFQREFERSLGYSHWQDPAWRPKSSAPRWIADVLLHEMERVLELIQGGGSVPESQAHWQVWAKGMSVSLRELIQSANRLKEILEQHQWQEARELYPAWTTQMSEWKRQLARGGLEFEEELRQTFAMTESRVTEFRFGLELILIVVVLMSLLLLWLGERALLPLDELTALAREITQRGLRKADKARLPVISLARSDEVSQLAREFLRMATALLEREKTVELQKKHLQDQNQLLREIGELNQNILNSIEAILLVSDLQGTITQVNPTALSWLQASEAEVRGSQILAWPPLKEVLGGIPWWENQASLDPTSLGSAGAVTTWKLAPRALGSRVYGGQVMPLRAGEEGVAKGAILVLEDLTAELDLQLRLRRAENLAAVGKMSAQVAHEVRNPLHAIGLEAEIAAELAVKWGNGALTQALQAILGSVDRLQKITENYLKFSRLSLGQKKEVNFGKVVEKVLATYAPVCAAQGVRVEWLGLEEFQTWADEDLLEQGLGNLFLNSLQALEEQPNWHSPGEWAQEWNGDKQDPREQAQGTKELEKPLETSAVRAQPCIRWVLSRGGGGGGSYGGCYEAQAAGAAGAESQQLLLEVSDNGPGIAAEMMTRLFTPFATTKAQGTGLGLPFVKQVIEDHGGQIVCQVDLQAEVAAKQGGVRLQGACFQIHFPVLAVKEFSNRVTCRPRLLPNSSRSGELPPDASRIDWGLEGAGAWQEKADEQNPGSIRL